jgi:hypothetical protein
MKQPYNPEGTASSNSQDFQSNHLHCELCLPRVEVNKFDGFYPMGRSLKWNIISPCMTLLMNWPNSVTMFSIWILNVGNGGMS